jgi:hypothetical protein
MVKTVIGLFATSSNAQRVVNDLVDQGIPRDDIQMIPALINESEESLGESDNENTGNTCGVQSAPELQGLTDTTPTSSVAVDLIEMGMPEKKAVHYSEAVRRGGTLVCVTVDEEQVATAKRIIDSHGSLDINNQMAQWRESGWQASPAEPDGGDVLVVQTTYVLER